MSCLVWYLSCFSWHKTRKIPEWRPNASFGRITVYLSGNICQVLPKLTSANEIRNCLKSSNLCKYVKTLKSGMKTGDFLRKYQKEFSREISSTLSSSDFKCKFFSYGQYTCNNGYLKEKYQPNALSLVIESMNKLFSIFIATLKSTSPLTPNYPNGFINSLELLYMPTNGLIMKNAVRIILLRNFDITRFWNVTTLVDKHLISPLIEAAILTGCPFPDMFTARIPIISSDIAFHLRRLEFWVRIGFLCLSRNLKGKRWRWLDYKWRTPAFFMANYMLMLQEIISAFASHGNAKNIYDLYEYKYSQGKEFFDHAYNYSTTYVPDYSTGIRRIQCIFLIPLSQDLASFRGMNCSK